MNIYLESNQMDSGLIQIFSREILLDKAQRRGEFLEMDFLLRN
jgi:hypothetical protein